jgi:hypothetical protein
MGVDLFRVWEALPPDQAASLWQAAQAQAKAAAILCAPMSAMGGKADMPIALQMSAYDPKRTSGLFRILGRLPALCHLRLAARSQSARL